ncbi:hypothetical protein BH09PAT2_BH09PAT2_06420 [soil metagenome]
MSEGIKYTPDSEEPEISAEDLLTVLPETDYPGLDSLAYRINNTPCSDEDRALAEADDPGGGVDNLIFD